MARSARRKLSKANVRYRRAAPTSGRRCGNCVMLVDGGQRSGLMCTLVAGPVRRGDVCDRWEAK